MEISVLNVTEPVKLEIAFYMMTGSFINVHSVMELVILRNHVKIMSSKMRILLRIFGIKCPHCLGTGKWDELCPYNRPIHHDPCPTCGGLGYVKRNWNKRFKHQ
jgi:hypothetical protein